MMKKLIGLILVFSAIYSSAQIKWITINQALEAQKSDPKKILIDFFSSNCTSCQALDNNTFNNPIIAKMINDNYYPVKFDTASKETVNFYDRSFAPDPKDQTMHPFAKFMNINSIPTMVFLDEKSQPITSLMGGLSAKDVEPYFTMISTNEYKTIKTRQQWDNYQKKFKSNIK